MTTLEKEWKTNGRDTYGCYRLTCQWCGNAFYRRYPTAKWCSDRCSNDAGIARRRERIKARRENLTCGRCGMVFSAARCDTRYCGGACRQAAYRARVTDKPCADICTTGKRNAAIGTAGG